MKADEHRAIIEGLERKLQLLKARVSQLETVIEVLKQPRPTRDDLVRALRILNAS